jgi:hypothetical protein
MIKNSLAQLRHISSYWKRSFIAILWFTFSVAPKPKHLSKMPRASLPEDKVNLRLILVSGKTKDFLFRPNESAGEISQYVFDNWPVGKIIF